MSEVNEEKLKAVAEKIGDNLFGDTDKESGHKANFIKRFTDAFKDKQDLQINNSDGTINELMIKDNALRELTTKMTTDNVDNDIKTTWLTLLDKIAFLQGLVLLEKLEKNTIKYDTILKSVISTLDQKIENVNSILQASKIKTQPNGIGDEVPSTTATAKKYLKYKLKYLKLKGNV